MTIADGRLSIRPDDDRAPAHEGFLEIARCGNFTRAAEELHICQPALTVQIKQLEHTLGVKLFDRDKRHVSLTQAGRDLFDRSSGSWRKSKRFR